MSSNALKDTTKNECIRRKLEVAPIEDKMRKKIVFHGFNMYNADRN